MEAAPAKARSPVTVGIVGAGGISAGMHLPALLAMPDCRVVWILDSAPGRAAALAKLYGLSDAAAPAGIGAAPSCDAVLLAVPLPPRDSYFKALLPCESVILAEKPLMTTAPEHRALAEAFAPWRICVGYQRRHYASSRMLKRIIDSGALGALLSMRIAEGARGSRTGGAGGYIDVSAAQGGGMVRNLGCHSLDLAVALTGANAFTLLDRRIEWDGDTDRKGAARIRLDRQGGAVDLDWTVSALDAQSNEMELRFENAQVKCPLTPAGSLALFDRAGRPLGALETASSGGALSVGQACYLEWRDVFAAVREKTEPPSSARSTLLAAEIMDAILERNSNP